MTSFPKMSLETSDTLTKDSINRLELDQPRSNIKTELELPGTL